MPHRTAEKLQVVQFLPGQFIFKESEESYHFYIIQSGEVEIYTLGEDGYKVRLATVGAGASVGEFAYIDKKPRSANVCAIKPVTAVMVSEQAYAELLQDLPSWALSLIENLVEKLRKTDEKVQQLRGIDAAQKTGILQQAELQSSNAFSNEFQKDS